MIKKYVFGTPFPTDTVIMETETGEGLPVYGSVSTGGSAGNATDGSGATNGGFRFTYTLAEGDIVYGLGEANRGINKRGFRYVNSCADTPRHTESLQSMYAAHNFIIITGQETFGLYFDYPASITFDVGYTRTDTLEVTCGRADLALYVIEGDTPYAIVRQFRRSIGHSYIPPKFAFGYGQSRWGYKTMDDFRAVADEYRERHIPLDMIYMDIDYMEGYKDFTVNEKNFPDFPAFVAEMKQRGIRLIPIIDAGVKVEEGYATYEEGVKHRYFCQRADGSDFIGTVWPGYVHFPDVLNEEARAWFGGQYAFLTDKGIEGFWNDMNEPAIFYTPEYASKVREQVLSDVQAEPFNPDVGGVRLAPEARGDYALFYHETRQGRIRHDQVHNLYGYYVTRAAAEGLARANPNRRYLLFSRSSFIGMHRYAGIWTGDNHSWWSHLLLNLKMMASLNMCGFLYAGADLGGFGGDTTRDLLLRWLALGVFTPLMRNHSAIETRNQECYRFEHPEDFRHVIGVRYRLLPYLYSEYVKAALRDDMYFRPLAFDYPEDAMAAQVEDQLMLGHECMIAPVYTQNAAGRYVYLPEEMLFVKFQPDGALYQQVLPQGHHYVSIALPEVPLFIRKGCCIPIAAPAETVAAVNAEHLALLGYDGGTYALYDDDGLQLCQDDPTRYRTLAK